MPPEPDATLQRASEGDPQALRELVAVYLPDLESFIRRRTGERFLGKEPLDDLVQSAAREALAHVGTLQYQGRPAFEAWLYRIALTKIIQKYRYHRASRRDVRNEVSLEANLLSEVCAEFGSPSQDAMAHEMEQRFTAAFQRLSPDHQQVFFLARVLELPHAKVAAQLRRSEQACRNMLVRAVAKLAVLLATDQHGGD